MNIAILPWQVWALLAAAFAALKNWLGVALVAVGAIQVATKR